MFKDLIRDARTSTDIQKSRIPRYRDSIRESATIFFGLFRYFFQMDALMDAPLMDARAARRFARRRVIRFNIKVAAIEREIASLEQELRPRRDRLVFLGDYRLRNQATRLLFLKARLQRLLLGISIFF